MHGGTLKYLLKHYNIDMKIETFEIRKYVLGPLDTNSYLVIDHAGNALLIDAPPGVLTIMLYLLDRNIVKLTHILITHVHFDHAAEAEPLREISGAKLIMHRDEFLILEESGRWARAYGIRWFRPSPDKLLTEDSEVDLGWIKIQAIHTPGHSPGSLCYYIKELNTIFTGDLIFKGTVGRTDLPGGSSREMINSLRKIILLIPTKTRILPGHGGETILDHELRYNPYVRVIASRLKGGEEGTLSI